MLSVRLTLLTTPGASRGGDGDGDGVNKVPQNTWAPQIRVEWCHGLPEVVVVVAAAGGDYVRSTPQSRDKDVPSMTNK